MKNAEICIVTTRNIFDAPCLEKYRSIIKAPYDIIYWDRCNIEEECGAQNYYRFDGSLAPDASKVAKLLLYVKFFKYVKKVLKNKEYKKLIVFPTQMGWIINRELKTKYKGKYLFDIRDYAGENNKIIKKLTSSAVNNAELCSITSDAYKTFLPERDYIISHNVQPIDNELISSYRNRVREAGPIALSFIGSVRFIEQQEKIIRLFGNDERFVLKFIGRGSEQLETFCKQGNYKNVELVGRFERNQLGGFYSETDMAINIYGNKNPYLDYALSNKLYSAAMMGMPILVSPDTYMAEVSERYGFGIAVDTDDEAAPDKVYDFFNSINVDEMLSGCDKFLESVDADEKSYTTAVENFLAQ